MTAEQIEELERLLVAATPGPWAPDADVDDQAVLSPKGRMVADCAIFFVGCKAEVMTANGRLIAAMRNALPGLLALAKRALAETPSAQPGPQATDPERVVADLDDSIPHPAPQ